MSSQAALQSGLAARLLAMPLAVPCKEHAHQHQLPGSWCSSFTPACRRLLKVQGRHSKVRRVRSSSAASALAAETVVVDKKVTEAEPSSSEAEEELRLAVSREDRIAGIPKHEWLRIQKPARYLGNEFGAVHKLWSSASVRFALTYPEVYEVGASNLGHIVLYTVLNQTPGLLCDRSYMPGPDLGAALQKYQAPLFAVESKRSLAEFDCLGFSLSYELGATNILEMLHLAGIPVSWEERREQAERVWDVEAGSFPLIFAGGPTATSNPEPFADFFDFFALGDGEESLPEIGKCLQVCKEQRLSREATLLQLARTVKGIYVPQFYDRLEGWGGAVFPNREGVCARVVRRVADPDPFLQIGLVPYVATVHDRLTVEIRRGCTRGCRFCQPGMLTRPARDVAPEKVVEAVEQGMRKTGYNEFSLLSLSCSDYLALPSVGLEIKNRFREEPITLSLPSQRVDRFDDNIANIVGGARRGGMTFAPEAGTQRMRDIINKGLTNEELLRGVKTAWERGWKQVKLYFMIGLPGETDADVLGIVETVKWLQSECRSKFKTLAVKLTISNFTPKPHTPFQWHTTSSSELLRKQQLLKRALRDVKWVTAHYTPVEMSAMEDFMGRGDRRIGAVIRRAWELGARNDSWWDSYAECFKKWEHAIEEAGISWKYRQVVNGEWDVMENLGDARFRGQGGGGKGRLDRGVLADARLDAPLPWDIVDTGVTKWWLKTDLQRALEAATVPDCSHSGKCSECGVCGEEFGDNVVAEVPPIPEFKGHPEPNTTRAQRLRVRFGKEGSMIYIGHLDLNRLFSRALRRAALPVSYDGGFNSLQRMSSALALQLGASSTAELMDIELTGHVEVEEFKRRLEAQMPPDVTIFSVEEVPVRRLDGKLSDSLTQVLEAVEYYLVLRPEETTSGKSSSSEAESSGRSILEQVRGWVHEVMDLEKGEVDFAGTNDPSKKLKRVDARALLLELELCGLAPTAGPRALWKSYAGPRLEADNQQPAVVLRCLGKTLPTGGALRPEALVALLNKVSRMDFAVLHIHRSDLRLGPPSTPKIDPRVLVSVANDDMFRTLYRRYDGSSRLDQPGVPVQPLDYREAARRAREAALGKTSTASELAVVSA